MSTDGPCDRMHRSLRRSRRCRVQAERRRRSSAAAGETIIEVARPPRRSDSAALLQAGHATGRQLPLVHGRDQGRARAGAVVLSRADRGHGGARATARALLHAQKLVVEMLAADVPGARLQARFGARAMAAAARHRQAALRTRAQQPPAICRTRRWRSTSTPASSARAACARAARSRSTTSSATRSAARIRRSCSISTIRWATSTCVACGECVQACPTGALAPANDAYLAPVEREGARRCVRIAALAASSPIT